MNKNETKKIVEQRKQQNESMLKSIGMSASDALLSIAIVVPHIGFAQRSFNLIHHVNAFLKDYKGIDINIYIQNRLIHIIQPLCGIFEYHKISFCNDPIICTNVSTCMDAMDSLSNNIYLYISSMDFLKSTEQDINKISSNKKVQIFLRDLSYKKYVEEYFDNNIIEYEIPDFNIETMIKKIVEDLK